MKTLRSVCWILSLLALAWVFGPRAVVAQDETAADDAAEASSPDEADTSSPGGLDVEGMLEEDQDVFAGRGYGYDPDGRRDPFISLQRTRNDVPDRGPRPDGVPGLLIGEVDLTGIFVLPEGPVAQVQTSDRDQSYLLRAGDKLYDGDVVSVSLDELVFRQILDDPTALTPFREVVKRLNP